MEEVALLRFACAASNPTAAANFAHEIHSPVPPDSNHTCKPAPQAHTGEFRRAPGDCMHVMPEVAILRPLDGLRPMIDLPTSAPLQRGARTFAAQVARYVSRSAVARLNPLSPP